jgi:hypothetical protein
MLKFTTQNMLEIITILEEKLNSLNSKEIIEFEVLNPDIQNSISKNRQCKIYL